MLFHYPWGVRHPLDPFANNPFHGGFLGVDAFFVLSGFLITTLLLQERTQLGRVSLRQFYARAAGYGCCPRSRSCSSSRVFLHFQLAVGRSEPTVRLQVCSSVRLLRRELGEHLPAESARDNRRHVVARDRRAVLSAVAGAAPRSCCAAGSDPRTHRARRQRSASRPQPRGGRGIGTDRVGGPTHGDLEAFARGLAIPGVWNRIYFGSDTRADTLLAGAFTAIVLFWLLPRIGPRLRTALGVAAVLGLLVGVVIVVNATVFVSSWMPEWGFLVFEVSIAFLIAGLVAVPHGFLAHASASRHWPGSAVVGTRSTSSTNSCSSTWAAPMCTSHRSRRSCSRCS